MNNVIILAVEVVVTFSLLLLVKKLFGRIGVIVWVPVATILANIITAKTANFFGIEAAIGTVMFASVFLATDILSECYSKEDAKKAVYIGLFSNVLLIISTQIALLYTPSPVDYANDAMQTLFALNLRISIASAVMYFVSNMVDVYLFNKLKAKTKNKKLWLRNNISTILCNCLENFGFIFFAFVGVYDMPTIISIAVSTSIIELIVALLDTPFLYISRKLTNKKELQAEI